MPFNIPLSESVNEYNHLVENYQDIQSYNFDYLKTKKKVVEQSLNLSLDSLSRLCIYFTTPKIIKVNKDLKVEFNNSFVTTLQLGNYIIDSDYDITISWNIQNNSIPSGVILHNEDSAYSSKKFIDFNINLKFENFYIDINNIDNREEGPSVSFSSYIILSGIYEYNIGVFLDLLYIDLLP